MPLYVEPEAFERPANDKLIEIRTDVRTLTMSPVQIAEKYNLPLWQAIVIFNDALAWRIRHLKNLAPTGKSWRF